MEDIIENVIDENATSGNCGDSFPAAILVGLFNTVQYTSEFSENCLLSNKINNNNEMTSWWPLLLGFQSNNISMNETIIMVVQLLMRW